MADINFSHHPNPQFLPALILILAELQTHCFGQKIIKLSEDTIPITSLRSGVITDSRFISFLPGCRIVHVIKLKTMLSSLKSGAILLPGYRAFIFIASRPRHLPKRRKGFLFA